MTGSTQERLKALRASQIRIYESMGFVFTQDKPPEPLIHPSPQSDLLQLANDTTMAEYMDDDSTTNEQGELDYE
jgi:hypothetical protein